MGERVLGGFGVLGGVREVGLSLGSRRKGRLMNNPRRRMGKGRNSEVKVTERWKKQEMLKER